MLVLNNLLITLKVIINEKLFIVKPNESERQPRIARPFLALQICAHILNFKFEICSIFSNVKLD
jgi:hypothetical protein